MMSQFSKRKYLKNFKEQKTTNNDKINERTNDVELVKVEPLTNNTFRLFASEQAFRKFQLLYYIRK